MRTGHAVNVENVLDDPRLSSSLDHDAAINSLSQLVVPIYAEASTDFRASASARSDLGSAVESKARRGSRAVRQEEALSHVSDSFKGVAGSVNGAVSAVGGVVASVGGVVSSVAGVGSPKGGEDDDGGASSEAVQDHSSVTRRAVRRRGDAPQLLGVIKCFNKMSGAGMSFGVSFTDNDVTRQAPLEPPPCTPPRLARSRSPMPLCELMPCL